MKRIGDYVVVRELGSGAMGVVYEATERLSGRRVALKVLHASLSQKEEARRRFFGEMQILAGLEHPNIVRSLANVEIDGRFVLVLEYLEGHTLREALDAGKPSVARAIEIASSVASALIAAHERNPPVVHRDLKPDNLMLLPSGTVKVMDFGVAKVVGTSDVTALVGTPRYMSPEQAEGNPITPAADLYSLGIVLYEMIAGQRPFQQAVSLVSVLRAQVDRTPAPLPQEVRRQLPPELERLVFALLAKSPADRPRDARAVLEALQRIGSSAASPQPKRPADKRWLLLAGAFVASLAAAVTITWIVANRRPPRARAKTHAPATVSATPEPSPVAPPRDRAAGVCSGVEDCTPFNPVDPSNVDLDLLLRESKAVAARMDPQFRLVAISINNAIEKGVVDLTPSRAVVTASYDKPGAGVNISTTATRHVAKRFPVNFFPDRFYLTEFCPVRQAWEAAKAGGFKFDASTSASLLGGNQGVTWYFSDAKEHDLAKRVEIEVSARTCLVVKD